MYNNIMDSSLECVNYTVSPIGFIIKKSKLIYEWTFAYERQFHQIKLFDSKYSSNKEVKMDDHVIYLKQKTVQLAVHFKLEDIDISLIQIGDEYDLRLNSCSFIHLLECNKNKRYFDSKENTSSVQFNQPSYCYYKQSNNVLPLSDFIPNDLEEDNKRKPLLSFSIHSSNTNELNQRLM